MLKNIVFILVVLFSSPLWAGGYFLPVRGAGSIAKGGTGIADPVTLESMVINPGTLSFEKGFNWHLDVGIIYKRIGFKRQNAFSQRDSNQDLASENLLDKSYPRVTNSNLPLMAPALYLNYNVKDDLSLGFAFFTPYGTMRKYNPKGPGRYVLVRDESYLLNTFFQAAYRISPKFRFGAAFGFSHFVVDIDQAVSGELGVRPIQIAENRDYDHYAQIRASQFFIPRWQLGLWIKEMAGFNFALSFEAPFALDAPGEVQFQKSAHYFFNSTRFPGQEGEPPGKCRFQTQFPWTINLGISKALSTNISVEMVYVFEAWSMHREILLKDEEIIIKNPIGLEKYVMGDQKIQKNGQNTHSIRVGAKQVINQQFDLYYGVGFETSALPDETISIQLADGNKYWGSMGTGIRLNQTSLIFGLQFIYYPEKIVNNGIFKSINPTYKEENPRGRPIQNDGIYNIYAIIFSMGVKDLF